MRPSAAPASSSIAASGPHLLVLGYQGTLQPDPAALETIGEPRCQFPAEFESLIEGWLSRATNHLNARMAAEQRLPAIDLTAIEIALRDRLRGILTQALALSPTTDPEDLARTFPALLPLLYNAATEWVDSVVLFQRRLHHDATRLATWLGLPALPSLLCITATASDSHAGGHKGLRLDFSNGPSLYYKPRPLTGESLWYHLLRAVQANSSLRLPSAAVLSGANDRYGWMQAVPPHEPLGSDDAAAYWHAAGATLCLAEHMRLTDQHMANVIATGRGPGLVDLESLATPHAVAQHTAPGNAAAILNDLLDTGLLPRAEPFPFPDTSGLFGHPAPVPGIFLPHWAAHPTAPPQLTPVPAAIANHANTPPAASSISALPHLLIGYREAAHALLRCRETLLAPRSQWLTVLENHHAPRIILRDTLTYGILLSRSLHPDALHSPHRRPNLLRAALQNEMPLPPSALRTELRTLLGLHIPRFTAIPGTRTLATSAGRPLATRYLAATPADSVLVKLAALTPETLESLHIPALLLAIVNGPR